MLRQAADIHEYDRDIDDHNVATWREEAVEKKEIAQMEELEELIEVRLVGRWATGGTVVVEGRRRRSS